jgi:glutathione S-transferase
MSLEVFWISGSPYSWRVLLALEAKRLAYRSSLLQASRGEHRSAEYLALNPRGRVPTLRDGDYVVYESLAILAYLDARYPDPPLFGASAEERGTVSRVISEGESYLLGPLQQVVRPILFAGVGENAPAIRDAARTLHGELALREASAAGSEWLAGPRLSAADLALYPWLRILLRAGAREEAGPLDLRFLPLAERYPALDRWMRRVEALPGYERTFPPHWR